MVGFGGGGNTGVAFCVGLPEAALCTMEAMPVAPGWTHCWSRTNQPLSVVVTL